MNDLVKKWRQEVKMTQEELAKHLFLTPQAVSLLENGKRNMSFELFQNIAKFFGKEVVFYIQGEPVVKEVTDEIIEQEIKAEILKEGILCIPEEDFETVLSFEGKSFFTKSNGILLEEATEGAFQHFKNAGGDFKKAKGVLVLVEGAQNFDFEALNKVTEITFNYFGEEAYTVFGCTMNDEEKRGFVIRVLATGLE